ncbi:MAG: bifunctional UDP-N-acetylglucosamine diphosphorylase/glucosamine-1-phosphate N-acetyltransferase GlmU [Pseudomonadota bacterium]
MARTVSIAILAAGRGTRMQNPLSKVLHPLAGRPLIGHVLEVAKQIEATRVVAVLAAGMDAVAKVVRDSGLDARIAIQDPPHGTGHAVQCAQSELPDEGTVLVLYGDTPLVRAETLRQLATKREDEQAAVAVLGMRPTDPSGYGRLRFHADGQLAELVEERHADPELKRTGLCNSGVMAIDAARLGELLAAMPLRPEKQEYYLTDIVGLACARGWPCTAIEGHWIEGLGINSQAQLAEAAGLLQAQLRAQCLDGGVIMPAPDTVHLSADTEIGPGAVIEPYAVFGPGVKVAAGAVVKSFSHLEGVTIAAEAMIGPFARLRPGTVVQQGARVGNFVELKNAELGSHAKASHLTYLGDCEIGSDVNIGAGTITCNYDGFNKHRTTIGAGAFIGSNTAFVAPVEIGADAIVGAGSTLTDDVPENALAIARERQRNLAERAPPLRERLKNSGSQRRS